MRHLLAEKLLAAARQARFVPRALRLAWQASGRGTLAWLLVLVLQGLVPVAIVYLTRPLVDGMAAASAGHGGPLGGLAEIAGAIAVLLLALEVLRSISEWLRTEQAQRIEDHLSGLIHEKSTDVDLGFYDNPAFHDHLHRAREEARYRPVALHENAGGLIQSSITLLGMASVLLPYGWWVSAALLASTLPAFIVVMRYAFIEHAFRKRTTEQERRSWYYDWVLTAGEAAAEVRLFGLGPKLRRRYAALRSQLRAARSRLARSQAFAEIAAGLLALATAGACVAWMGWRAVHGEVSLGAVALFYFSFSQGQRLMRSLLSGVGQVYRNVLFLENLFAFLDLRSEMRDSPHVDPPPAGALGLRFDDVTFQYPGSDRSALRNFNLAVPAGQVAAIVGANGAGKSTLLKLLCRFYDPQAGRVSLGDTNLRDLHPGEVRSRITVLFQQPVRYHETVTENIALDDGQNADVEQASEAAGARAMIERLPAGYQTRLGRWFGEGVELSVGEWQRIALARAFARRTPVVLLDEPTSAMDSWTEADWMRRFRALAHGRTAIIVTHRFTTAMQADVIHVMEDGRVIESGSHGELLARGGRYAQSWRLQMREGSRETGT